MLHKAWRSIEEVPCCFLGSSIKFLGHTAKKSSILTRIERFRTVTYVWIYRWHWNDAQNLMYLRRGALLFFDVIYQISWSHRWKNWRFESNLRLLGRQLPNPSDLPCSILLPNIWPTKRFFHDQLILVAESVSQKYNVSATHHQWKP